MNFGAATTDKMPKITMTIINSIRVKPWFIFFIVNLPFYFNRARSICSENRRSNPFSAEWRMPVVTYVQHLIPSNAIVCKIDVGLLVFARIMLMFLWFPAFAGMTVKWMGQRAGWLLDPG